MMIASQLPLLHNLFPNIDDWGELGQACIDTLLMLGGSLLLTVIIGLPLVTSLKCLRSAGRCHGKALSRPITPFSARASTSTISDMFISAF